MCAGPADGSLDIAPFRETEPVPPTEPSWSSRIISVCHNEARVAGIRKRRNTAERFFGERATAVVTHIRREGGERAEVVPNRYTYNISYTFVLPDGKEVDGFVRKIGGAVHLKADGTGRIAVRYVKTMPVVNAPEKSTPFSPGQVILMAAGVFLIAQMNRKATPR